MLESFEKSCKQIWETLSTTAAKARVGSQDGSDKEGLGLQQVVRKENAPAATGVTLASATSMTTGPSSKRVGTGVVTGAVNCSNRDLGDTNIPDLGGSGQRAETARAPNLKAVTSTATGPSLVQVGTGTVTGAATGLDWVLSDGEDDVEVSSGKCKQAIPPTDRSSSLESTAAVQTTAEVAATDLVQADEATATASTVGTAAQWSSSELLARMNEVCVRVARTTIPTVETVRPSRVRPSLQSKQFAEQRAVEIAAGVTPQRRKELH